ARSILPLPLLRQRHGSCAGSRRVERARSGELDLDSPGLRTLPIPEQSPSFAIARALPVSLGSRPKPPAAGHRNAGELSRVDPAVVRFRNRFGVHGAIQSEGLGVPSRDALT